MLRIERRGLPPRRTAPIGMADTVVCVRSQWCTARYMQHSNIER